MTMVIKSGVAEHKDSILRFCVSVGMDWLCSGGVTFAMATRMSPKISSGTSLEKSTPKTSAPKVG